MQGQQSNIQFSYYSYAADRLADYKKEKVRLFKGRQALPYWRT